MHDALGDRVNVWTTLNEPWCSSFLSYTAGLHAPGHYSKTEGMLAAHHLLLGHGQAVRELRARDSSLNLGITLNLTVADPVDRVGLRRPGCGPPHRRPVQPVVPRPDLPRRLPAGHLRRDRGRRPARSDPPGRPRGDLDPDRHAGRELLPRRVRRRLGAAHPAEGGRCPDRPSRRVAVPLIRGDLLA